MHIQLIRHDIKAVVKVFPHNSLNASNIYAADIFLVKNLGKPADRSHCTESLAMLLFWNTFFPLCLYCTQKLHLTLTMGWILKRDCLCRNFSMWIAIYLVISEVRNSHVRGFLPLLAHNLKFKRLKYIFRNDTLHGKFQPRVIFFYKWIQIIYRRVF